MIGLERLRTDRVTHASARHGRLDVVDDVTDVGPSRRVAAGEEPGRVPGPRLWDREVEGMNVAMMLKRVATAIASSRPVRSLRSDPVHRPGILSYQVFGVWRPLLEEDK